MDLEIIEKKNCFLNRIPTSYFSVFDFRGFNTRKQNFSLRNIRNQNAFLLAVQKQLQSGYNIKLKIMFRLKAEISVISGRLAVSIF